MNKDKNDQLSEKEKLSSIVKRSERSAETEWLPADFGEREKQLRMARRLSQQDVADMLGTSVSTISRLENGLSRTVDIELLGNLTDLYDVSADFLLGKVRTPERMYFSLKDIGLTPEAGLALYSGKADASTVNTLLMDEKFQGLTYAIKDYLAYTPGKDGKPIPLLIEVCSDSKTRSLFDYCGTNQPLRFSRYAEKMHGFYKRGSLDALGDGFKSAVKEIRKNNESYINDGIKLTVEMLRMIKGEFSKSGNDPAGGFNSPEYITDRILSLFAPDGKLTETSREFLAYFRNSLISMDLDDDDEYTDDNGI